jgi:hypothetical protein
MLGKLKARLANFFGRVLRVFTEVETFIKTAGVTVIGGGVNAVAHQLMANGAFVFDAEHLAAIKASFIGGALTAFFFYLMEFPALKKFTGSGAGGLSA